MKRLSCISCISALLTGTAVASAAQQRGEEPRPNILWLTYEDTSPQFIGCYATR